MTGNDAALSVYVRCRTGSSEKKHLEAEGAPLVRCRTGSSENALFRRPRLLLVRCRTGSSETGRRLHRGW